MLDFESVAALRDHASARPRPVPQAPWPATGRDGRRLLHPGDPPYAEARKLDPEGRGTARYEILPGEPVSLCEGVQRLTAPNPGVMTGPGTNTYLIAGADGVAVIDPGPDDPQHVERIVAAAGGAIRWILVTHTHRDHSPASGRLQTATGAQTLGLPAPPHDGHERDFAPDRVLAHGERLDLGGAVLRVIHTPGHASNHLCYLLEEERLLFSGDHIMQGSTVVISPPDGDMAAYLASLEALLRYDAEFIAPGHGFLMAEPPRVVDRIVSHRLVRESKVIEALRERPGADAESLLSRVYDDVPQAMHPVARRSLLAHLIKLRDEGRAAGGESGWRLIETLKQT